MENVTGKNQNDSCCSSSRCCSSGSTAVIEGSSCGSDSANQEETAAASTSRGAVEFDIEGMDCSSCAQSIEKHFRALPWVSHIEVHFASGKMRIAHGGTVEGVLKEIRLLGYQATLSSGTKVGNKKSSVWKNNLMILSGLFLLWGWISSFFPSTAAYATILYAMSMVIGGWKPTRSAYYAVKNRSLDMNALMIGAAIGAAVIGEWLEGAVVVWLFALGNWLQNRTIERTRNSIRKLMDLAPSEAWVQTEQGLERKPVEKVQVGEVIVIKPGEKIPLDGRVTAGTTSVNQAPITGEAIPVDKTAGDEVYAGSVNEEGSIEVEVTRLVQDTALAKIIHLVEEAQEKQAPTQSFVDRFARIYTPIVFGAAVLLILIPPLLGAGEWKEWLYRGLELLVIACPCALVISTPVAIVSAIGNAAKNGVLIKGGTYLEMAGKLKAIAFDKTGTLTEGKPRVAQIIVPDSDEEKVLSIARTIEEHSRHPIAQAIIEEADRRGIASIDGADYKTLVGRGAQAAMDQRVYYAGNGKLFEEKNIPLDAWKKHLETLQSMGHTPVLVGTDEEILGLIAVSDVIRETSKDTIRRLKQDGIQSVMLTGDQEGTARKIASDAGLDQYHAELLPEEKVQAVKNLQQKGWKVGMVGDGMNDAPALAAADLGIAMGGVGTDTAMETADVVLMADNLEQLPFTMRLSRKALTIIKQNIVFSVLVKLAALALIFPNWLTLWIAVMSDTGAALLVILNSMRLLRMR
jgi:Zn2+/Cd2+-exporting ATPase